MDLQEGKVKAKQAPKQLTTDVPSARFISQNPNLQQHNGKKVHFIKPSIFYAQ